MWNTKNTYPMLVAFLLAFCVVGSCSAMEITNQEMQQLEINLNKLESINKNSQAQLKTLKSQLEICNQELNLLNSQVKSLRIQSTNQEFLLKTANESLKQYEKEMKIKNSKLKRQRNIFLIISAFLVYKAVK